MAPPIPAASTALGAGIPMYGHPGTVAPAWAALALPDVPVHWVILNQASGPGETEDPVLYDAARAVRDAGTPVLGYITLQGGSRDDFFNNADADLYVARGFTGAFLDECPADSGHLQSVAMTVLRQRAKGMRKVVLNPGVIPAQGYCDIADQVIVFEGDLPTYRRATFPDWMRSYPATRFAHLVHGVRTAGDAAEVLRLARRRWCSTVYAHSTIYTPTTNTWDALPAYWPTFSRTLAGSSVPGA
ncbi:spherulation-specific family 4 protein [Streptomyces sp. NPDC056084]|uniref:spherulation-specific family 4 protein n=1 Tax=unclassified Streptomyces TaxID=2593676 RepID=UPI0035D55AB3